MNQRAAAQNHLFSYSFMFASFPSRHTLQILASPALHLRRHRMALQHGTAAFGLGQEETRKLCTKISMTSSPAATLCTRISFLRTLPRPYARGSVPLPVARSSRQRTKKSRTTTRNFLRPILASSFLSQANSEHTKSLRGCPTMKQMPQAFSP